jgi:menaquinone-dependent protoporphyrinogen oxidase
MVIMGVNVDVKLVNAKEIRDHDVSVFDLIVVGSGIKMGKWTKESINFLKKNRNILSNKKSCIVYILWSSQHRKINGRRTREIFG